MLRVNAPRNGRRQTGLAAHQQHRQQQPRQRRPILRTTICVNARARACGTGIVRAVAKIIPGRAMLRPRARLSIGLRNAGSPAAETRNQIKRAKTFANLFIYAQRPSASPCLVVLDGRESAALVCVCVCVHDGQITRAHFECREWKLYPHSPRPARPQGIRNTCVSVMGARALGRS